MFHNVINPRIPEYYPNITSNKWSKKKWDKEPAEIKNKHCLLVRGTCTIKPHNIVKPAFYNQHYYTSNSGLQIILKPALSI